jgi:hypothetical protein
MNEPDISRWSLIRDMFIFQIKLAMDAIRDLLLSPVSVICGLIDIFKDHSLSNSYFHKLMALGQQSDSWLNLFGNHSVGNHSVGKHSLDRNSSDKNSNKQDKDTENSEVMGEHSAKPDANVDQLFSRVEALLKEQHSKGGLTASAKATIDHCLNKIARTNGSSE